MTIHRCIGCDERLRTAPHGTTWALCPECKSLGLELVERDGRTHVRTAGSDVSEPCELRRSRFAAMASETKRRAA